MKARWTAPEITRLRLAYPVMSSRQLTAAFPRHPWPSIKSAAHQLGLRKAEAYGGQRWREIAARHVPVFRFDILPARIGAGFDRSASDGR